MNLRIKKQIKILLTISLVIFLLFAIHVIVANYNTFTETNRFYSEAPEINLEDLDPGDILFARNGYTALIPGYWSHTAIFAGYDELGQAWIIESKRGFGVRKTPIEQFLSRKHVAVAKVKDLSKNIKLNVLAFAEDKIGLDFNIKYFGKEINSNSYYCSEVVWAAYKNKAKVDLDTNPGWSLKYLGAVAPQEMFEFSGLDISQLRK
jgi:uncharacterized protein YycO